MLLIKHNFDGTKRNYVGQGELYRQLLQACHITTIELDHDGRVLNCDSNGEALTGFSASELAGSVFLRKIVAEKDRGAFEDAFQRALIRRELSHVNAEILTKTNHLCTISFNFVPHISTQGTVKTIYVSGQLHGDTLCEKQSPTDRRHDLNQILENVPIVLFNYSAEGKLTYISHNAAEIYGVESHDLMEDNDVWMRSVHPEDREQVSKHWRVSLEKKCDSSLLFRLVHPRDKKIIWLERCCQAIFDKTGQFKAVLGITLDVSKRKNAEAALIESEERLRRTQKTQAIGHLAGGIAHDFNNLLSSIMAYAELLDNSDSLSPKHRRWVRTIVSTTQKGAALSRQLTTFASRGKSISIVLDFHNLIEQLSLILNRTLGRLIQIEKKLKAPHSTVFGDPNELENTLMNLALNARDAMSDGGILTLETKNIELDWKDCESLELSDPGTYLEISVRDTGPGIPADLLDPIFEPFFTTKPEGKGTGLGLSCVAGCVKSHNGMISVESELGTGSIFKILLPVCEKKLEQQEQRQEQEIYGLMKGNETIMLVDDEPVVREGLSMALRKMGYKVVSHGQCQDALRFYDSNGEDVDLVIADLLMPEMNGVAFIKELKKIDAAAKILLISGNTNNKLLEQAIKEGVVNVISKPVRIRELSQIIASAIGNEHGRK